MLRGKLMIALEWTIVILLSLLVLDKLGVRIGFLLRLPFLIFFFVVGALWCLFHPKQARINFRKYMEEETSETIWEQRRKEGR